MLGFAQSIAQYSTIVYNHYVTGMTRPVDYEAAGQQKRWMMMATIRLDAPLTGDVPMAVTQQILRAWGIASDCPYCYGQGHLEAIDHLCGRPVVLTCGHCGGTGARDIRQAARILADSIQEAVYAMTWMDADEQSALPDVVQTLDEVQTILRGGH